MKRVLLVLRDSMPECHQALISFIRDHFECVSDPESAESILVLGGDGTMLGAIDMYQHLGIPFVGLNLGHVGFLMNEATVEVLEDIAADKVESVTTALLQARMYDKKGRKLPLALAFNEFYMERSRIPTAKIRVSVGGTVLFDPLIADGIIVATAAGSTAYNASATGTIIPLDAKAICLTGIAPAIFHAWRNAVLSLSSEVTLEALETDQRPVRFLADGRLIKGVHKAIIAVSDHHVQLLFVTSHDYRQKVLNAQFGRR